MSAFFNENDHLSISHDPPEQQHPPFDIIPAMNPIKAGNIMEPNIFEVMAQLPDAHPTVR